jgi:hypothetical protein
MTQQPPPPRRPTAHLLALVVALVAPPWLGGCSDAPAPVCDAGTYAAAVRDAAEPDAADLTTSLWAITPENPRLTWNGDRSAVLMVTWTGYRAYTTGAATTLARQLWLTAVPQLQALCRSVPSGEQVARIQQYLGLPPATTSDGTKYLVELWVSPGDLFRPCPDAEIDDTGCQLTFPAAATADHKAWMNANYAGSYGFWQATQYPWTGLGYTYDWCNPSTHVGASEFVVRSGATVTVAGQYERDAYCAP